LLTEPERRCLNLIQSGFPLEKRPYAALGKTLHLDEQEVFAIVQSLYAKKIIRRLGANFDSAKLGFKSTLCAAKVPEDKLAGFIHAVNSLKHVTHNYLRDHSYNVWFTVIAPAWEDILDDLRGLEEETGVRILNLPASGMYKIKVDFDTTFQPATCSASRPAPDPADGKRTDCPSPQEGVTEIYSRQSREPRGNLP
jgi:DNA-binding Lrp family transcriptional regulator